MNGMRQSLWSTCFNYKAMQQR